MKGKTFCTIVEPNYLYYALALNDSLVRFDSTISLIILITGKKADFSAIKKQFPNISFLYDKDLCKDGIGKELLEKYAKKNINAFRWSMKGVLMSHLLKEEGYKKVIFVDADIYFFSNYDFLWEELNHNRLLLTPHWRAAVRFKQNPEEFTTLLTDGLFNAGFVAANQEAIPILDKWSEWCLHKCEKNKEENLYCDQGYLNLIPAYYEGIKIIKHKGCNVAAWNLTECTRTKVDDKILIEGAYEIIFIHFVRDGIWFILVGLDNLLKPYLAIYVESMKKYYPNFDLYKHYRINELQKEQEAKDKAALQKKATKIFYGKITLPYIDLKKRYIKSKARLRKGIGELSIFLEEKMGIKISEKLKENIKNIIIR